MKMDDGLMSISQNYRREAKYFLFGGMLLITLTFGYCYYSLNALEKEIDQEVQEIQRSIRRVDSLLERMERAAPANKR